MICVRFCGFFFQENSADFNLKSFSCGLKTNILFTESAAICINNEISWVFFQKEKLCELIIAFKSCRYCLIQVVLNPACSSQPVTACQIPVSFQSSYCLFIVKKRVPPYAVSKIMSFLLFSSSRINFIYCKCWIIYLLFVVSTVISQGLCKMRLFKIGAFLVIHEKCLNFFGLITLRK